MNIIIEGPEATGKTFLSNKLIKKYNMCYHKSSSCTSNDYRYHLDLLKYNDNRIFDRFHLGEIVFPKLYKRDSKMTTEELKDINRQITDNGDLLIILSTTDSTILKNRLADREEHSFLKEIDEQCILFNNIASDLHNMKNCVFVDISKEGAYEELDKIINTYYKSFNINRAYKKVANDILKDGTYIDSKNLRGNTVELSNYSFTINDLSDSYVSLVTAKTSLEYIAAEILWYIRGQNDLAFISEFSSMWSKVSDDGITSNSAYGYILQNKHGFNQIETIINLLKKDPDSRRAVIKLNVPNEYVATTKDEICTLNLIYQIRDNKLNSTTIMRSNDFTYGLRNDLPVFIELQKYIARRLGINVGSYTHFTASMHIYKTDIELSKKIAYGDLTRHTQILEFEKLYAHKEILIKEIENGIKKEDFKNRLHELSVIKERMC